MCKISILVPIYNVKKYLPRCLKSIECQSFDDFEVILVDDGSTDNSLEICNSFARHDKRFVVFHKNNQGISATRNFALNKAKGEYILFVDSDDYIEPTMLEKMYSCANNDKLDVVGCNFVQEYPFKNIKSNLLYKNKSDFIRDMIRGYWATVWKLLIRRDIYINNSISFPDGIDGGEDYYFCSRVLLASKRAKQIEDVLYHYNCLNENSFIRTPSLEKLNYQVIATVYLEDYLKMHKLDIQYHSEIIERKKNVKMKLLYYNLEEGRKTFPDINAELSYWKWVITKIKTNIRVVLSTIINF